MLCHSLYGGNFMLNFFESNVSHHLIVSKLCLEKKTSENDIWLPLYEFCIIQFDFVIILNETYDKVTMLKMHPLQFNHFEIVEMLIRVIIMRF